MPTADVEVAVVGGGAMGAATAWHLAERGRDVVVLERFGPGHAHGSSHGNARIFRLAYPEADYVALAREALPLWDRLEAESGRHLRHRVGELDHGDPATIAAIAGHLAAAGIEHERLTAAQATARWPGLRFEGAAVLHPEGGTTDAAATVTALLELAAGHGADVRHHAGVARLRPGGDHVAIDLAEYSNVRSGDLVARTVVVTPGAWAPQLLAEHMALPPITVTREQPVLLARNERGDHPWPSFIHYHDGGPPKTSGGDVPVWGYGLPTPDGHVKLGEHHTGEVVHAPTTGGSFTPPPVEDEPSIDAARLASVQAYAQAWLPGVDAASASPERCLYTTTDTTDFVLDRAGRLVIGAGFSGHGFKFVPRIGQLLADLVDGGPRPPARFRLPSR